MNIARFTHQSFPIAARLCALAYSNLGVLFRQGGTAIRIAFALIALCLFVTPGAFAAGIPWSNGQQKEYSISGFTASDSVTVDAAHGKLYVTDRERYRVLRFAYPLTSDLTVANAEMVFGQADFSGTAANRGGAVAANTLSTPYGLAVGPSGELWISDYGNNRLLKFPNAWTASSGVAASVVLGQSSFTASSANTTASGLQNPCGLSIDASTNLWVGDMGNNRALRFNNAGSKTSGASADGVLGQANFTSGSPNRGGNTAANTLSSPYGLCAVGTNLWVAEYGNCRVLRFNNAATKATAPRPLGPPAASRRAPTRSQPTTVATATSDLRRPRWIRRSLPRDRIRWHLWRTWNATMTAQPSMFTMAITMAAMSMPEPSIPPRDGRLSSSTCLPCLAPSQAPPSRCALRISIWRRPTSMSGCTLRLTTPGRTPRLLPPQAQ